jgi:hypothetical protein
MLVAEPLRLGLSTSGNMGQTLTQEGMAPFMRATAYVPTLHPHLSASGCCSQLMILPTLISSAWSCASSASLISPDAAAAAAAAAGPSSSLLLMLLLLLLLLLLLAVLRPSVLLVVLAGMLSAPVLIFGTRTKPDCISGTWDTIASLQQGRGGSTQRASIQ